MYKKYLQLLLLLKIIPFAFSYYTPNKKSWNEITDICVRENTGTQRLTRSLKGTTLLTDSSFIGHKPCGTVFHKFEDKKQ